MNSGKKRIMKYWAWGLAAAAAILIFMLLSMRASPADVIKAAKRSERSLSRRMESFETYISKALDEKVEWIGSLGLPEDMVISRPAMTLASPLDLDSTRNHFDP